MLRHQASEYQKKDDGGEGAEYDEGEESDSGNGGVGGKKLHAGDVGLIVTPRAVILFGASVVLDVVPGACCGGLFTQVWKSSAHERRISAGGVFQR